MILFGNLSLASCRNAYSSIVIIHLNKWGFCSKKKTYLKFVSVTFEDLHYILATCALDIRYQDTTCWHWVFHLCTACSVLAHLLLGFCCYSGGTEHDVAEVLHGPICRKKERGRRQMRGEWEKEWGPQLTVTDGVRTLSIPFSSITLTK